MSTDLGASRLETPKRAVACLLLVLGAVYLLPFVTKGWVPLDEGMIGQAAERVLTGQLPHVDYEEPYTGALSYFYAAVFKLTSIDLANLRWTVFLAALVALAFIYVILRRNLSPIYAALGTWVALVWSFPNYFSSLPSWWILLCALVCLWGLIRYVETDRLIFVVIAGLAAGVAVTIKQTGLYLLPPLIMSLLVGPITGEPASAGRRKFEAVLRAVFGMLAFTSVILMTRSGLGSGELVYLVAPIGASCLAFGLCDRWTDGSIRTNWRALFVAVAAASVPVAILLLPHIAAGQVGDFIHGVFVLPQNRLEFTRLPMRPASQIVAAAAGLLWIFSPGSLKRTELRILEIARWIIAVALVLFALRSSFVYTFIWEAVRGSSALLPIVALWLLAAHQIQNSSDRRILFGASAMLAWTSLSQFPFAAPIYFCYVAPLGLIAGVTAVKASGIHHRLSNGPALAVVLLFAVLSLNRGYVWNLGQFHQTHDLSAPLDLPRAHLYVVKPEADAFRRVIPLVHQHIGEGGLVAGPDTPEIYFLTGQFSPSGRLFDFFSRQDSGSGTKDLATWTSADVIVLFHGGTFSPPLSETLVSELRQEFPQGEAVPPFEVRWR